MKRILAIDCGTTSGAAFDNSEGRPVFVTWYGNRWSAPGEFGARLHEFDVWVSDLITLNKPDAIAFEAPLVAVGGNVKTNHDTVRFLYGLAAEVERIAYANSIASFEVNVGTVKKQFAGSGRAQKSDVMFRARQLGWEVKNEHEADAAALWFFAKSMLVKGWTVPILGRVA